MKCNSCGGRLEGRLAFCPFCGVRQEVDLRQIHFRQIVPEKEIWCPDCSIPLGGLEFDTAPPTCIERCGSCNGMFFNPGELEFLLEKQMEYAIWLDPELMDRQASVRVSGEPVFYRKCPTCREMMNRVNFGGRSGVILDRCGAHGFWLDAGELRQIMEWWRAGGKLIHQKQAAALHQQVRKPRTTFTPASSPGSITSVPPSSDRTVPDTLMGYLTLLLRLVVD